MIAKVVYKYPLDALGPNKVTLPMDARIVHVGIQGEDVCLWAEHHTETDKISVTHERTFDIYGTGWGIPETAEHIGTVMRGPYVWHVYEVSA